ncbi:MAG TPA: radical SAM protein [Archangium sp.]|uniref:KamA family radical SAM protein n=1 Tax=Archangium sp. TaxID=1872627 RepID=UPI002E3404A5|nr:radical SAM protein [Archangium sp.]HEX5752033.1 radical SAM protein [Archangium sp.]
MTAPAKFTPETLSSIPESSHAEMVDEVKSRFRYATTRYIKNLMEQSDAVRKQFEPSFYELMDFGKEQPFEEGKDNSGIYGLERIYEDRAVITPYFGCASYCRYCFKKTRTLAGDNKVMPEENIDAALEYIRADPRITTALITGGDPLAKPALVYKILEQLSSIPHITKIRIGSRHILFQPDRITTELAERIASYNRVDPEKPLASKNISIGVSINHADELQPEVIRAVQQFTKRGVTVRGQMVLMKGINDDVATLKNLLDHFLAIGIVPYYLFHCMDVIGTYHMRTSVQRGLDILAQLAEFSGTYAVPYVYVTPVGKHRVAPGMTLDYEEIDGKRYIRRTSPYKAERFLAFSGKKSLPALHEVDENGYIVSRYLDGNDTYLPY